MNYPLDDDFVIQATQIFNDSVASEGLVAQFALVLENKKYEEQGEPKECTKSFVTKASQVAHMTAAAIFMAVEFQEALDDYRKHKAKQKSKKGFKDL